MSLFDKWDVDFIKSHKEIGNIAVVAFYYENDPQDCINFQFNWNMQVDDLIGDSLFEAFNRTACIERSFAKYVDNMQFSIKLERVIGQNVAAGLDVDITITKFPVADNLLDAA